MASSCLKNAIDKYWRKTAPNSIKEEERLMLKNQFLQYLNEPELKLARQMSVILGKIARFDLPLQWPDLITKLVQILQESSILSQEPISSKPALSSLLSIGPKNDNLDNINSQQSIIHNRSLMALHQIIKSLASKRLINDRKIFEQLSLNIINLILELAFYYLHKCLNDPLGEMDSYEEIYLINQLQEHSFYLDQAIICLKILHKLVLNGFKDNTDNLALSQLMTNLIQTFEKSLIKYNQLVNSREKRLVDYFKEKYEYIIDLYIDILHDYHETCPFNFIQTSMEECFNLILHVCFTAQGKAHSFPKLIIQLMNFMKSIIMCDKYKQRLVKLDDPQVQQKQQKAIEIKQHFLTKKNLQQIMGILFNEYLLMTEEELESWRDSPEEFINEDGTSTDAWKYNYRACAETLFQAFVHEYHDQVVPIVVELLETYSKLKPVENSDAFVSENLHLTQNLNQNCVYDANQLEKSNIDNYILLKDASYNCGSIAAWELISSIDFDVWFTQALLPELKGLSGYPPCHILIKRRILILISNWVNIKLSTQYRPSVYEVICELLQPNQNVVIRLQACLTLKAVMDDVHFEKESYLPYLNFHFGLLCQLLKEVEECETKIKVLSVLSFLVERVDIHIRPYCSQLADYLPFLWQESANFNMLRCSIVTAFHHIVKSFGAQSINYHSFLMPVIHYSTDSNNPASVYLLEDGLELWNITIQNSLEMSHDMLNLFSNIKPLLDRDTDIWKLCLDIIDSYIILDARKLFQYYGDFLMNKCCELLSDRIKIDALLRFMRTVGQMFEVPADNIQIRLFEPLLIKAINLSMNSEVYPMIMAMCLSMLARPTLEDGEQFMKIVEKCAQMRNQSVIKLKIIFFITSI